MATTLDAVQAARAGRPLTPDERRAFNRFVLGGGSGTERFYHADGRVNLAARYSPALTVGQLVDRQLGNAATTDWLGRFGSGTGYNDVIGSGTTSNVTGQEFVKSASELDLPSDSLPRALMIAALVVGAIVAVTGLTFAILKVGDA